MSATETAEAMAKLTTLSEERARRVFSLIEDLAELEALEDAQDLKDARETLAELKADDGATTQRQAESANTSEDALRNESGPTIPYEQLRRELGLDR